MCLNHAHSMQARDTEAGSTARVWMKSAIVEREAGDVAAERKLLQAGIQAFPNFAKLHLMLGQLEERAGNTGQAPRTAWVGLSPAKHLLDCKVTGVCVCCRGEVVVK